MITSGAKGLKDLMGVWQSRWEEALTVWSRFTRLAEPLWCFTIQEERKEKLVGSFAMIRLNDHAVVISLRQIREQGLDRFAVEILAHELGHHVFAPGDLRDNARLLARMRAGLPSREQLAGLIGNLYTDLLINDRLQRGAGLDMAGVYKQLKVENPDKLWLLYQRICEVLWRLPPGFLTPADLDRKILGDAALGARVIRAYAKEWLDGAGRFAALCLPYLLEAEPEKKPIVIPWLDARSAGVGDVVPDGLAGIEDDELDGAIHPALDGELTGLGTPAEGDEDGTRQPGHSGRAEVGGRKNQYRSPQEYTELMKSIGVDISEAELIVQYYRERALPHLIRFPVREIAEARDPLPEGLDPWDTGSPLTAVDWLESVSRSPYVIPGVTTVQRSYGDSPGGSPEREPVDLYLGVDCSGSMNNPAHTLSYPVLAGTIIVLSALRAGSRVMATLSGEPGEYSSTDGFIRRERDIMRILTGYLGTGYAFGILRLKETFLQGEALKRPVHILVVTDSDIFHMLKEVKNGWNIAREALAAAGGGGTMVLNIPGAQRFAAGITRLRNDGWNVHLLTGWDDLLVFAREFSRENYEDNR